jgi:NADPH:quinone reductase-like Zn-dependent oxidoreductase
VGEGRVRPVVDRSFALADAQKAHEYMGKTGATGKILLVP